MKEVTGEPKRRVTIGLMWHSLGSGNLGVGALTESNIAIIRDVAERLGLVVCFVVLGTSETTLPNLAAQLAEAGHELQVSRIRVFRRQFRDTLKLCDLVIDIGEGDSFADIYGFKRFFYYWLSKNIVCALKKPLILAPQTIGPFNGFAARMLAKQVLKRCTHIFTRDNLSTLYLKQLGIKNNIIEATDVAFRLPFVPVTSSGHNQVRVGINVSGLLFNGGYTGENQFNLTIDYAETIRKLINRFLKNENVEIHLVAHVVEHDMPAEDDYARIKSLSLEFPNLVVAPPFSSPSEAKSYISGLDFFTGARMHACIAAFSSEVPVVPMSYSRKFNGLFGTLAYEELADCKKDSEKDVVEKILSGFEEREQLRAKIISSHASVSARLDRYEKVICAALNGRDFGACKEK